MPGGNQIWNRYEVFKEDLPKMCERIHLHLEEINFNDYCALVSTWLNENSAF